MAMDYRRRDEWETGPVRGCGAFESEVRGGARVQCLRRSLTWHGHLQKQVLRLRLAQKAAPDFAQNDNFLYSAQNDNLLYSAQNDNLLCGHL